ncbi:hypothetical protein H5410_036237 [Solanum commersonii]|uniref:Uncharacterized protein n=1 Tax=Solanum commersonii TaxID=4109 RepID=A0A9J5Y477_SOLCO|nr:hypothetical protein H5410_036237 [Solanum commersonii]
MRRKDLIMSTLINYVELFIVSSTTLCSDSQNTFIISILYALNLCSNSGASSHHVDVVAGWNIEHYLWGLFYCTRQDTN